VSGGAAVAKGRSPATVGRSPVRRASAANGKPTRSGVPGGAQTERTVQVARPHRKLTEAERDERRRRDRERLAEATRALLSSDGWHAWLRARAAFHDYSLRNTLLIAQEGRRRGFTPTHVAGFKAWLKLGRSVRKGERGIAILAPVRVKERDSEAGSSSEPRTSSMSHRRHPCPG
jgi:N-terminal domain of anti-restriction factor ArdC